jgi:hypothetical protein
MAARLSIFFIFSILLQQASGKRLSIPDLKISLESERLNIHPQDILFLRLKIENVSSHRGSILIPYHQNFGKALFQLRICRIDSLGSYIPVFESSVDLEMDTTAYRATEGFWHLESGESYIQPFFINDFKNAAKRVESSIGLSRLPSGKYALQMLYLPDNSPFFRNAFKENELADPILEDDVTDYPDHFIWHGPIVSNWLEVNLSDTLPKVPVTTHRHCSLCRNIYKQRWRCVKQKWDALSRKDCHSAILWRYGGPQSVQSSLPAYMVYDVIFQTETGIAYAAFRYRLGIIFPVRSRLASLFYLFGFRRPPFKTSDVNKVKLLTLRVLGSDKGY